MRYTVITAFILFIITVIIFTYYVIYINGGILNGNVSLNMLMLSLVIISAILAMVTYIFSRGSSGRVVPQQYMA